MTPDAPPALCGNGTRECGEECDDHNMQNGDGCDSTCRVEPYAGAPQDAVDALHAMNALRAEACVRGATIDANAVASSQNHANYYANNPSCYTGGMSPHVESATCGTGFTGVQFYDRMSAAGFAGQAMFETMAFSGNPQSAVSQWLNTVFHRVPMLHPNMATFGYGKATGVDVADYGSGSAEKLGAVIVWPPPNATGIARSFNIAQEGPNPPAPPGGGGTTGPIISVFFANGSNGTLASHSIKDAAGNTLPDTLITPSDATYGPFLMGGYTFYAAGPAPSGAKFTVSIAGTVHGQSFNTTWSFTTQ